MLTEAVPFARPGAPFTTDFEDLVRWLATTMDKTALRRLLPVEALHVQFGGHHPFHDPPDGVPVDATGDLATDLVARLIDPVLAGEVDGRHWAFEALDWV